MVCKQPLRNRHILLVPIVLTRLITTKQVNVILRRIGKSKSPGLELIRILNIPFAVHDAHYSKFPISPQ